MDNFLRCSKLMIYDHIMNWRAICYSFFFNCHASFFQHLRLGATWVAPPGGEISKAHLGTLGQWALAGGLWSWHWLQYAGLVGALRFLIQQKEFYDTNKDMKLLKMVVLPPSSLFFSSQHFIDFSINILKCVQVILDCNGHGDVLRVVPGLFHDPPCLASAPETGARRVQGVASKICWIRPCLK